MAVADHSIDPRILKVAKDEFLKHGYEKASLKDICGYAGITTGALYKRYKGKEDLFRAVVAGTLDDLDAVVAEKTSISPECMTDRELILLWEVNEKHMMWWFHFLYDRREGFLLLLDRAEGTCYSNFQHDWVERMTTENMVFLEEAQKRKLTSFITNKKEFHILLSAFWTAIYEPFIHGFSWEEIETHCKRVCHFFDWRKGLGLYLPEEIPY